MNAIGVVSATAVCLHNIRRHLNQFHFMHLAFEVFFLMMYTNKRHAFTLVFIYEQLFFA